MAHNITLTNATFGASSKSGFGQSMTGGYGTVASVLPVSRTFTLECWAKTTNTGTIVMAGTNSCFWMASAGGKALAHYNGATGDVTLSTTVTVNDGLWHHFRLAVDSAGSAGGKFYVDGVLAASSATQANGDVYTSPLGIRTFAGLGNGYDWVGETDEYALWSTLLGAGIPASPYIGNEANLLGLWHLDGDGTDTAGAQPVPATAITLIGPSAGVVSTQSTDFTVALSPAGGTAASMTVTPATTGTGTFSPTSVTLATGFQSATFKYTPSGGSPRNDTISVTNNGGLANPAGVTYAVSAAPTAPGAPTMGTAVASGSTATVPFTAPSNGGSPITSYTVSCYRVSGDTFVTSANVTVSPATFAGLANGVAVYFKATATNGVGTGAQSAASNSVTPASLLDTTKLVFSPGNWLIGANSASSINPGAYFRTLVAGNSLNLLFDMTGVTGTLPRLKYRVNGQPWVETDVAASVAITIPAFETTFPHHLLEVVFKSADPSQGRWTTLGAIVKLADISGSATLANPTDHGFYGMYFGDSITEGNATISNAGSVTLNNDSQVGWAFRSAELLGAEAGIVGFGSQGIDIGGAGGVPALTTSYPLLWSGVNRPWPTVLDYVVINMGTNDGAGSGKVASCTAILNGILAAVPTNTKIFVMRPFNGNQAGSWTAAITACNAPARCIYVDTTGWFDTSDAYDGLHPNAYFGQAQGGEKLAKFIRATLAGAAPAATAARTVTLTLADSNGVLANLSGLSVAFYDQATPGSSAAPMYKTEAGTTNGSGVLTFVAQSTLPVSGTGRVEIRAADGRHYNGQVVVA